MTAAVRQAQRVIDADNHRCVVCGKFVSTKEIAKRIDRAWPVHPDTRHETCTEGDTVELHEPEGNWDD